MRQLLKRVNEGIGRFTGFQIIRSSELMSPDERRRAFGVSEADYEILKRSRGKTLVSFERLLANLDATEHIVKNNLDGSFVECGVWRGGSMMVVLAKLIALGEQKREIFLFDTYEGMTEPTARDVNYQALPASDNYSQSTDSSSDWCYASLDEAKDNIFSTGYARDRIHFVKGDVAETIPITDTGPIAFLRLDTDWYESTKVELDHLFGRVRPDGVIIIDDYGHWQGQRQAVDEFLKAQKLAPLLHRIDYTGRMILKKA